MSLTDDPAAQITAPPTTRRRWGKRPQPAQPPEEQARDLARARLIARLNQIMLPVTGRPDVLATMVWGAPDTTPPAWYDPATATITLNADQVILNDAHPDQIDPTHPLRRFDQPVLIGVCAHEGGHARSQWDLKAIRERSPSPRVMAIATYLLESWAEAGQLRATPGAAPWLRTAARHILQFPPTDPDADEDYQRARALVAALLVLARVDAGVLQPGDIIAVESIVVATLGQPTVNDLRALWQQALTLEDGDADGLCAIAQRVADVMGWQDEPDDHPAMPGLICHSGGAAGGQAGGLTGGTEPGSSGDSLFDAISDLAGAVTQDATDAIKAEREATWQANRPNPHILAAQADEAAERAAARQAAQIFADPITCTGPLRALRAPTAAEQAAATHLAEQLRLAGHRSAAVAWTPHDAPPGRLDPRQAMAAAAQRSRGLPVTAKPFQRRQRTRVPQPFLRMGFAADVSGSMGNTADALACAAWICAQAVGLIGGRTAALAWGSTVTPLIRPGASPSHVPVLSTPEGTVVLPEAIRALDGALALSEPGSLDARLLIIASDGELTGSDDDEDDPAVMSQSLIDRLRRNGCAVLWLCLDGRPRVLDGAVPVEAHDPVSAARAIGQAATTALRLAGR
ncbi:hypothetical protein [Nonomuraea ceibae]|uniref:hypothetical protein n=1 Tax=Nonomuraea ceibae TaxID=1935170 RepID=UPI001C5D828B|nr:hypothetical protein [Nonomuraea ceibae]